VAARIIPVIMSGGSGSRLWPMSTDARPKQFQPLGGERTLIQETARRFAGDEGVEFLDPIIICNAAHRGLVRDQFAEIGIRPAAILLEPLPRNTAAVAALAALAARQIDPEALVLLAPADHLMRRPLALTEAVARATGVAHTHIVTFGIQARTPATGYGYIKRGQPLNDGVFQIDRFLEKPPLDQAIAYVEDGSYDWNAGLFLFSPSVMSEEMQRHAPDVWAAVETAFARAAREDEVAHLDADAFARAPSISVDNAIMELTDRGAVAPCDPDWSDIGSWSELWHRLGKDADGNAAVNSAVIDGSGNLAWSVDDRPVAVVGMSDVIVISTEAGVLVIPRDRDQDVRKVHEALMALKAKS